MPTPGGNGKVMRDDFSGGGGGDCMCYAHEVGMVT